MRAEDELIVVFIDKNPRLDLVTNFLEDNGIQTYSFSDGVGTVYGTGFRVGYVRVAVKRSEFERANMLLKEFLAEYPAGGVESSFSPDGQNNNAGKMWICPNCGENCEPQFDRCWNCQTLRPSVVNGN